MKKKRKKDQDFNCNEILILMIQVLSSLTSDRTKNHV